MSQSTMAAARQYEMKTSIAVVTTMICGRDESAGRLGSGAGVRTASPSMMSARQREPADVLGCRAVDACLFVAECGVQLSGVRRVHEPPPAARVVEQPRRRGEQAQVRSRRLGGRGEQQK